MLAREVKVLRGELSPEDDEWSSDKTAMFDLFINKDISKLYKTQKAAKDAEDAKKAKEEAFADQNEQQDEQNAEVEVESQ